MTNDQREKIVSVARSLIGTPYKYGAAPEEAPAFFDCSSFTQYCMRQVGIELPRSTILQAEDARGKTIRANPHVADLQVGDLLFFRGTRGHYSPVFPEGVGHVAIYLGEGRVVHAGSERTSEHPVVLEIGVVEERKLSDILQKLKTIVTVKRF